MPFFGFNFFDPDGYRSLYQSGEASDAVDIISPSELPPPTTSGAVIVSVNGSYQTGSIVGTTNEVAVVQNGTTLTVSFASGLFLKGYNDAAAIRTRLGLGTLATKDQGAAVTNVSGSASATYVQAETQALYDKLNELLGAIRGKAIAS